MSDMMHEFLQPNHWTKPTGYSHGIVAFGRQIHVAGQIGWNGNQEIVSDDFVAQVEQALHNIVEVLAVAKSRPEHLVRLNWYITDKREYLQRLREVGRVYRRVIGRHYPAMAVVQVAALIEDKAKVEIEATAVIPT
jgi:enamine deaminase RidA (YjgF/YER057c/UK114 family)